MDNLIKIKRQNNILGNSNKLNQAINIAIQVAPTDLSVLIIGESGSGKDILPKIVHQNSKRKHENFIAVNCGAIPEGTIDSELFGHEKGSFTGAIENRKGYFEFADKGTIFLDEIAELPMSTQARLLRILESGEYFKVGSSICQKSDIRIIAATNKNIEQLIREGKFRSDLYYRLNSININIPPLRERKEDIKILFLKFINDFSIKYKKTIQNIDETCFDMLEKYNWPGNIRQLKNFTEKICALSENSTISYDTIKKELPKTQEAKDVILYQNRSENINERELLYKFLIDMKHDLNQLKKVTYDIIDKQNINIKEKPEIVKTNNTKPELTYEKESLSIEENEKNLIKKALKKHHNKRNIAAEELGISERTLYRKINDYNL